MDERLCRAAAAASLIAATAWGCSGAVTGARIIEEAEETRELEEPVVLGEVSREEIEQVLPDWVTATVEATPDFEAAQALASVGRDAGVRVYLGTWCSDSRRELGRLWRALDDVGGLVPFEIAYIGVDRDMTEPRELVEGTGLERVPTFIVTAEGRELGRVVEESPNGIEADLLSLLRGETEGLISATVGAGPD